MRDVTRAAVYTDALYSPALQSSHFVCALAFDPPFVVLAASRISATSSSLAPVGSSRTEKVKEQAIPYDACVTVSASSDSYLWVDLERKREPLLKKALVRLAWSAFEGMIR